MDNALETTAMAEHEYISVEGEDQHHCFTLRNYMIIVPIFAAIDQLQV